MCLLQEMTDLKSWYLFYVGNSGLGPFNFAISAWQNLLYLAGFDPNFPRGTVPCGDAGGSKSSESYIQVAISWPSEASDLVRASHFTSNDSKLHCAHYKWHLIRLAGGFDSVYRFPRGLRYMASTHHHCVHLAHVGSKLCLVGSNETEQVSVIHSTLTLGGKPERLYTFLASLGKRSWCNVTDNQVSMLAYFLDRRFPRPSARYARDAG